MGKVIEFKVLENGGQVVGFSLVPRKETVSEQFCSRLQAGLPTGEAVIRIDGEEIVCTAPEGAGIGEFRTKIPAENLAAIGELLADDAITSGKLVISKEPLEFGGYGFRCTFPDYDGMSFS